MEKIRNPQIMKKRFCVVILNNTMKNFLFLFLLFNSVKVYCADITLLFDYKPNVSDVERVLGANKVLERKTDKVKILFLGNIGAQLTYKELVTCGQNCFQDPTCDFIESVELIKFIKSRSFDNIFYKNGEELIREAGLSRVSSGLNYLTKKTIRDNSNVLILDLIEPIYPFIPEFEIQIENEEEVYYVGDELVAEVKFKADDDDRIFDVVWKINNKTIENIGDSIRFNVNSKKTEISCSLQYPGSSCKKNKNLIIQAKPCENIVPYSLDINDKTFFRVSTFDDSDVTRYVQLHEIQNNEGYNGAFWILPVFLNCPIKEFKFYLEELNENGKRVVVNVKSEDIQFGEEGGLIYSLDQLYSGSDDRLTLGDVGHFYYELITGDSKNRSNMQVIVISGMSDRLMGKEMYLKLLPVDGKYNLTSLPEYKLSFNQCTGTN